MRILLDTCVVSELISQSPDSHVIDWTDSQEEETLYLSVLTVGELEAGIEKLASSRKKSRLREWLQEDLLVRFEGRVLPINEAIAFQWGGLIAALNAKGRPMPIIDSLLAASALSENLSLATRNERDFIHSGVKIINPWKP